jgi:hypothetical protein
LGAACSEADCSCLLHAVRESSKPKLIVREKKDDAKGGAKPYLVNGKMTGGFAYVAYPAKYGETGIQTFIINQNGVVFEKDLGKDTGNVAKTMTGFNPDKTWAALQ